MFGLGLGLGIHRHSNANPYAFPFISRVESDGGVIRDKVALFNLTNYLQSMMPNTKLLYCPELGAKLLDESGLKLISANGLSDAAEKVVAAVKA